MNILYLAPEIALPGSHGGAAHVEGTLSSLENLGHKIIAVSRMNGNERIFQHEGAVLHIRIPVIDEGLLRNLSYLFFTFIVSFLVLIFYKIDIVYERGRLLGGIGIMLGHLFRTKSIYELNEPYYEIPVLLGRWRNDSLLFKIVKHWHDYITKFASLITVTHESLIENGVAPKDKTIVVTYGVNSKIFSKGDIVDIRKRHNLNGKFAVLYTGSFAPWHSCDQIIKTAGKNKKIVFLLVGDGDGIGECRKLAKQLRVEDSVIFAGKVPFDEIPSYVRSADACIALFDRNYPPFKKFSFFYSPMKVMEYFACGKPVIASDFGNLKKLIKNKKNGLLVRENNINEIADAITYLVENKNMRVRMGRLNRKIAFEKYDWDLVTGQILEALGKVN